MKTILILLLSAGVALANQLGDFINSSASFTRPGDTTAYASGDLVANSTTAGSVVTPVVPVSRSRRVPSAEQLRVDRIKLLKSTVTTTNASFRVHLYKAAPTTLGQRRQCRLLHKRSCRIPRVLRHHRHAGVYRWRGWIHRDRSECHHPRIHDHGRLPARSPRRLRSRRL